MFQRIFFSLWLTLSLTLSACEHQEPEEPLKEVVPSLDLSELLVLQDLESRPVLADSSDIVTKDHIYEVQGFSFTLPDYLGVAPCPLGVEVKPGDESILLQIKYLWHIGGSGEYDAGYFEQEPMAAIMMYDLRLYDLDAEWMITEYSKSLPLEKIHVLDKEFYRVIMPGMVNFVNYFYVGEDRLFHFFFKNFPLSAIDKEIEYLINHGFMLLLQSFQTL